MGKGWLLAIGAAAICIVAALTCLSADDQRIQLGESRSRLAAPKKLRDSGLEAVPIRPTSSHQDESRSRPHMLRANSSYDIELDGIALGDQLPELIRRSKDDPTFAYSLATALQKCATQAGADEHFVEDVLPSLKDPEKEEAARALNEQFAPCAGLPADTAAQRFDLISSAAAAGVLEAQINYRALAAQFVMSEGAMARSGVMDEYKERTLRYAREAALSGAQEALYNAYEVVSSGLFSPSDKVAAHSYLYAHQQIRPSQRGAFLLSTSSKGLTAQQLARAEAEGKALIARN